MIYKTGDTHSTFSSLFPPSEKKNLRSQNLKITLNSEFNNTVLFCLTNRELSKRYEPRAVHIECDTCKQEKSYSWQWSNDALMCDMREVEGPTVLTDRGSILLSVGKMRNLYFWWNQRVSMKSLELKWNVKFGRNNPIR